MHSSNLKSYLIDYAIVSSNLSQMGQHHKHSSKIYDLYCFLRLLTNQLVYFPRLAGNSKMKLIPKFYYFSNYIFVFFC